MPDVLPEAQPDELPEELPDSWRELLSESSNAQWYRELQAFVAEQRQQATVFPPQQEVFRALELTPPTNVRCVILGQDPYHGEGQAHGLCFSVREGVKHPPSLRNIFKERESDLQLAPPQSGNLDAWAREGVLLLNTVLTVRAGNANSHQKKGWEDFTDDVIRQVDQGPNRCVFVLWGKPAQKKRGLLNTHRHRVVESAHPSPLSAHRGFLGSRPFTTINDHLVELNAAPIDWRVDEER